MKIQLAFALLLSLGQLHASSIEALKQAMVDGDGAVIRTRFIDWLTANLPNAQQELRGADLDGRLSFKTSTAPDRKLIAITTRIQTGCMAVDSLYLFDSKIRLRYEPVERTIAQVEFSPGSGKYIAVLTETSRCASRFTDVQAHVWHLFKGTVSGIDLNVFAHSPSPGTGLLWNGDRLKIRLEEIPIAYSDGPLTWMLHEWSLKGTRARRLAGFEPTAASFIAFWLRAPAEELERHPEFQSSRAMIRKRPTGGGISCDPFPKPNASSGTLTCTVGESAPIKIGFSGFKITRLD
jgi:hypothetical protein